MSRSYEIYPRPANQGAGWNLKLIENGHEAGGGVFPVRAEDADVGMAWWNGLTEERRAMADDGGFRNASRCTSCLPPGRGVQRRA